MGIVARDLAPDSIFCVVFDDGEDTVVWFLNECIALNRVEVLGACVPFLRTVWRGSDRFWQRHPRRPVFCE